MAKKKQSLNALLADAEELINRLQQDKRKVTHAQKKCINHPDKLIYRKNLCIGCYQEDTNTTLQAKLAREPWVTTNGYTVHYRADGSIGYYHRTLVEQLLGRKLESAEKVRFKDGDKRNLSISNLVLETSLRIDLSTLLCAKCKGEL